MRNQLKAMQRRIPAQPDAVETRDAFKLHLFSDEEQARLCAFLARIESDITRSKRGTPLVHMLSVQDRDQLETWTRLQLAIDAEESATAMRCRAYLELTSAEKEAIYAAFVALDETLFPDITHCIDAPTVRWDGAIHYLYRGGLRWMKDSMRQHKAQSGYWRRWEIDEMWFWLAQAEAREWSTKG